MNGMTCREFDGVVHGLVRMEILDVNLREVALDHCARCSNCTERWAEAVGLAEATQTFSRSLREQRAPASVETAVLAAFRNHHRRAAWRRTFEWATAGAAAAIVLVFLWNFSGLSRGQSPPSPRKDVSSQSRQPLDAKGPASSQPAEVVPASETTEEAMTAGTGETLATEDFVPLPSADAIGPENLGVVVRVQLTRASLAELGYPVVDSPDPGEDLISADVLVGEDGWPRAVKLVQ
jgi:hypothetical protein